MGCPRTRMSTHRCASLPWLSWISCIACISYIISTTKIYRQLISWDFIDIAGRLVPQKYLTNLFREISLTKQGYLYHRFISPTNFDWLIDYHWLSLIIIDFLKKVNHSLTENFKSRDAKAYEHIKTFLQPAFFQGGQLPKKLSALLQILWLSFFSHKNLLPSNQGQPSRISLHIPLEDHPGYL